MSADAQHLDAIIGFRLTTNDLPRLVGFYRDVLGFAMVGPEHTITNKELALLGVQGGGRRQVLRLGDQLLGIDRFDVCGRPYPAESTAGSLWFQHLALVVVDMEQAYQRVRAATAISQNGPQLLPPSSGSVHAFKFRDLDSHPLELLQFPAEHRPAAWRDRAAVPGQIGLGIDHSAISVENVEASVAFYAGLGLRCGGRSLNEGVPQQHLDGLEDVKVAVISMLPPKSTPHLELLGYQQPRGGAGPVRAVNDVAATRIVWSGVQSVLLRDPDGYLQQIEPLSQERAA